MKYIFGVTEKKTVEIDSLNNFKLKFCMLQKVRDRTKIKRGNCVF